MRIAKSTVSATINQLKRKSKSGLPFRNPDSVESSILESATALCPSMISFFQVNEGHALINSKRIVRLFRLDLQKRQSACVIYVE